MRRRTGRNYDTSITATLDRQWEYARHHAVRLAEHQAEHPELAPATEPHMLPDWVWTMTRQAHPNEAASALALEVLMGVCRKGCASGLMDKVFMGSDERLIFESYRELERARVEAEAYATRHGLNCHVAPVAWSGPIMVRAEFYPS